MNEHHADPPDVPEFRGMPRNPAHDPDPEHRTTRCEGCDHEFAAHLVTDDFCADCAAAGAS